MSEGQNRFERHAKKTIISVLFVFAVLAVGVTEYVLRQNLPIDSSSRRFSRYIRLRENPPNLKRKVRANIRALEKHYGLIIENLSEKSYRYRTDANGFIRSAYHFDSPDLNVVFLGGSTTECVYVDEHLRFPSRAGELLSERFGRQVNSCNAGFRGNNSMHSLHILLSKVVPLRPDVVVMMHVVNDVNILLFSDTYWNDHPSRSIIVDKEKNTQSRGERFWQSIRENVFPGIAYRLRASISPDDDNDEFEDSRGQKKVNVNVEPGDFEANLKAFVQICRAHNILPVLMTQFNRFTAVPDSVTRLNMDQFEKDWGVNYETYKRLNDRFNQVVREVAQEHDVTLIDLDAQLAKDNTNMYDIVHLNGTGSARVAEIISETLGADPAFVAMLNKKS